MSSNSPRNVPPPPFLERKSLRRSWTGIVITFVAWQAINASAGSPTLVQQRSYLRGRYLAAFCTILACDLTSPTPPARQ